MHWHHHLELFTGCDGDPLKTKTAEKHKQLFIRDKEIACQKTIIEILK